MVRLCYCYDDCLPVVRSPFFFWKMRLDYAVVVSSVSSFPTAHCSSRSLFVLQIGLTCLSLSLSLSSKRRRRRKRRRKNENKNRPSQRTRRCSNSSSASSSARYSWAFLAGADPTIRCVFGCFLVGASFFSQREERAFFSSYQQKNIKSSSSSSSSSFL